MRSSVNAFVYGTLCDPQVTRRVLGQAEFGGDARLVGLHRVDGQYPTLAPGGVTDGRVLWLDDGDLSTLDRYEGVDRGLYVRVRVPHGGDLLWVYVGDPDVLDVDVSWPGDGPLEEQIERYVDTADVCVE